MKTKTKPGKAAVEKWTFDEIRREVASQLSKEKADVIEARQALALALHLLADEQFDEYQRMKRKLFMHRLSMAPAAREAFDRAPIEAARYDTPAAY